MVRIGSVAGPGFISGNAGLDQVVRDGSGNFWIGDGGYMNVYGPSGEFIRTVGREGGRGADGVPVGLSLPRTWSGDAANPGQPLHIVDGGEVLVSFGAEYGPGDDPSDFNHLDLRHAATALDGSIMVAHQDEYRVEVWSRDHAREPASEHDKGHERRRRRAGVGIAVAPPPRLGGEL